MKNVIRIFTFLDNSNKGKIDDELFLVIAKYADLKDVILKFMRLSWNIRHLIQSDNYLLYKKFLKLYSLNKEMRRSDMIAYVDVLKLIKENVSMPMSKQAMAIMPTGYYSNCGAQDGDFNYFVHNIFNLNQGYLTYCSGDIPDPSQVGINIQAYLG